MKKFEQICKMSQTELKKFMENLLIDNDYTVENENGFLYAIPKNDRVPVLLVAHMDTVHKEKCTEIINNNGALSSPQGIGGDDRCGIYMIINIINELRCPVLLTEDEEIGGVGARKFANSKHIKDLNINYMIEFDRRGSNDAVYYSCDNKDFKKFIEKNTNMKEASGSYSDISTIMPASKIAGVNFSCGYYNAHQITEYVIFNEMLDIIEEAKYLIRTHVEEPFEYVAKVWPKYSFDDDKFNYHQFSLYDNPYSYKHKSANIDSVDLELEVVWNDINGDEQVDMCYGRTKAECWFNFFMDNPEVCMDMVTDYSWN